MLVYRAFCISLENLIKIPLNKKALGKKRSFLFPQIGAPVEANAHFVALTSFGVPSKGVPPPGSPNRAPIDRDAPQPEPSFSEFPNFTVDQPPGLPPAERHPSHPSLKVPGK
jgi:hypothetical protein